MHGQHTELLLYAWKQVFSQVFLLYNHRLLVAFLLRLHECQRRSLTEVCGVGQSCKSACTSYQALLPDEVQGRRWSTSYTVFAACGHIDARHLRPMKFC